MTRRTFSVILAAVIVPAVTQQLERINPTSIAEFREAAAVRAKYFGTHRPASTLVQISQLANPAFKVEIEAIAVLP